MKAWKLASTLIAISLTFFPSLAQADCAAPPASCYCRSASAVIDGRVEKIEGDLVTVKVDEVTTSATPLAGAPQVGSTVELSTASDLYGMAPKVGDRILATYDMNAALTPPVLLVGEDGQVSCDFNVLGVEETTNLLVAEDAACRKAVEQRFGKYECDDTGSSCALGPAPAGGAGIAAAVLAFAWSLRRRRGAVTAMDRQRRSESQ